MRYIPTLWLNHRFVSQANANSSNHTPVQSRHPLPRDVVVGLRGLRNIHRELPNWDRGYYHADKLRIISQFSRDIIILRLAINLRNVCEHVDKHPGIVSKNGSGFWKFVEQLNDFFSSSWPESVLDIWCSRIFCFPRNFLRFCEFHTGMRVAANSFRDSLRFESSERSRSPSLSEIELALVDTQEF